MKRYTRVLIVIASVALASGVYAAAGDPPSPKPETLKPAEPPRTPAGAPAGFPVLAIPLAIVIGAAVAVGTKDDEAVFPTGTGTGTTGTR